MALAERKPGPAFRSPPPNRWFSVLQLADGGFDRAKTRKRRGSVDVVFGDTVGWPVACGGPVPKGGNGNRPAIVGVRPIRPVHRACFGASTVPLGIPL